MIFDFSIFLFGILFVIRTIKTASKQKNMHEKAFQTRATVIFLILLLLFAVIFIKMRLLIALFFLISSVLITKIPFFIERRLQNQFQKRILLILNHLILQIRSGKSFRHAFDDVYANSDAFVQHKLSQTREFVYFTQQIAAPVTDLSEREFHFELQSIALNPQKALQKLESYRNKIKIFKTFRHKSGQASMQVMIQIYILTFLYLGLLVFVLRQYKWEHICALVVGSAVLFIFGLLMMYFLKRRFKWKI